MFHRRRLQLLAPMRVAACQVLNGTLANRNGQSAQPGWGFCAASCMGDNRGAEVGDAWASTMQVGVTSM
jgi:hypothetical protein